MSFFFSFFPSFCSHAEGTINEVVDPQHSWYPRFLLSFLWASLVIFQSLTDSIICKFSSFTLPAVMGGTWITLILQSTLIHRLQWTMLRSPQLEEHSSGQSHNVLKYCYRVIGYPKKEPASSNHRYRRYFWSQTNYNRPFYSWVPVFSMYLRLLNIIILLKNSTFRREESG